MEHPPPLLVHTHMVITIVIKVKKTKHFLIKLNKLKGMNCEKTQFFLNTLYIHILILNLQLIHESFLYTFQVLKQLHVDLTISQIAPLLSSQVNYQDIFKTMFDIFFLHTN